MANWSVQKTLDDMDKGGVAHRHHLADHAASAGPGCRRNPHGWRARSNEYRQETGKPAPRPFRHLGDAAAAACRRKPEGDRIRLRYAEGRRYRRDDELRRQVARLRGIRAGLGGAEPPQGHRLHTPDGGELLHRQSACAIPTPPSIEFGTDTTRAVFTMHLQRHGEEVSRHQLDLGRTAAAPSPPCTSASPCRSRIVLHGAGKFTRDMVEKQLRCFYYDYRRRVE